ncbi:MAG: FecR family protein, partial [Bacteroidota bacterium]
MMEDKDKMIDERLKGFKPPFSDESFETAKSNVFARTTEADNVISIERKRKSFSGLYAAAAGLALLLSLPFAIHFIGNQTISGGDQSNSHILPDGSEIKLAANSNLSYNDILWTLSRSVSLDGEAFFKVAKGEKFDVKTEYGIVSVLGTEFTVWEREGSLLVHCLEGRVDVEGNILVENNYIILDDSSVQEGEWQGSDEFISLKQETLTFDNTPLDIIVEIIEERFDKEIVFEAKGVFRFSGNLDPQNLENSLEIL